MNAKFREAAEQFEDRCESVQLVIEQLLPQAIEAADSAAAPLAAKVLDGVSSKVDGLMYAFDQMRAAIGMHPRYWYFFEITKLDESGLTDLKSFLSARCVDEPAE